MPHSAFCNIMNTYKVWTPSLGQTRKNALTVNAHEPEEAAAYFAEHLAEYALRPFLSLRVCVYEITESENPPKEQEFTIDVTQQPRFTVSKAVV